MLEKTKNTDNTRTKHNAEKAVNAKQQNKIRWFSCLLRFSGQETRLDCYTKRPSPHGASVAKKQWA